MPGSVLAVVVDTEIRSSSAADERVGEAAGERWNSRREGSARRNAMLWVPGRGQALMGLDVWAVPQVSAVVPSCLRICNAQAEIRVGSRETRGWKGSWTVDCVVNKHVFVGMSEGVGGHGVVAHVAEGRRSPRGLASTGS